MEHFQMKRKFARKRAKDFRTCIKEIRTYEKEKKVHLLDGMNWQISYLESESVEQIQKALQEWKEVTSLPIHIFLQEKPIKRGFKKPPNINGKARNY